DLGNRVRKAARADVVDRRDRVALAERPARVDDLLRAALHLRVAALHGREVEALLALAAALRRRGAAAEPDQHRGTAEHDELRAGSGLAFLDLRRADIADTARDHDRLMIAAPFAVRLEQARAEVAGEIRPPELVVALRGADRPVEHDRERRRDPRGTPGALGLPRPRPARQLEMRDREAREPCLRARAASGRALVANLTAGAGRGARERRDRGGVVVRLDLDHEMRGLDRRAIDAGL